MTAYVFIGGIIVHANIIMYQNLMSGPYAHG